MHIKKSLNKETEKKNVNRTHIRQFRATIKRRGKNRQIKTSQRLLLFIQTSTTNRHTVLPPVIILGKFVCEKKYKSADI